jgi:putative nucleotidyltransferase-like protein
VSGAPTYAARIAATNLQIDAGTAQVLRAFEGAGVRSLLLKGAALNRWLASDDNPRAYLDADLLVRPADLTAAERALADLGLRPVLDEHDMPDWWREHATTWAGIEGGATIDLHRTVVGVGVDPEDLWETLSAQVETIDVAGYPAWTLKVPGRALHLALHAAQHGAGWDRPLADLETALSVADESTWAVAAELARALQATPAFATGLRLLPAGDALADRLGLPHELSTGVALRAGTPPPVALGLDQLAQAGSSRARLAILRHKFFPPPSFMRHWSRLASRGTLGLALAYLWRPLWLLARLPAGFRAWWKARARARQATSEPGHPPRRDRSR